jgi:hypothetical protein
MKLGRSVEDKLARGLCVARVNRGYVTICKASRDDLGIIHDIRRDAIWNLTISAIERQAWGQTVARILRRAGCG